MSKYTKVTVPFKTAESMLKALGDLGLAFERGESVKENSVTLRTHWSMGQDQPVAIAIQREALEKKFGGWAAFDGLGFAWNGKGYDLVQDHSDQGTQTKVAEVLQQIRQRYAFHEANRALRAAGLNLVSTSQQGKTIQLTFERR